jgi:hypothetical protein
MAPYASLNSSVGWFFKPLGESLFLIREYPKQGNTIAQGI